LDLIQRFSDDMDIFLDPLAFKPILGSNDIDRELKKLRDAVGAHPAFAFVEMESQTIGRFGRNDRFSYAQRFGGPGKVAERVFLETGTASGRKSANVVELESLSGRLSSGQSSTTDSPPVRFRPGSILPVDLLSAEVYIPTARVAYFYEVA
jgi:hypothetical protein